MLLKPDWVYNIIIIRVCVVRAVGRLKLCESVTNISQRCPKGTQHDIVCSCTSPMTKNIFKKSKFSVSLKRSKMRFFARRRRIFLEVKYRLYKNTPLFCPGSVNRGVFLIIIPLIFVFEKTSKKSSLGMFWKAQKRSFPGLGPVFRAHHGGEIA